MSRAIFGQQARDSFDAALRPRARASAQGGKESRVWKTMRGLCLASLSLSAIKRNHSLLIPPPPLHKYMCDSQLCVPDTSRVRAQSSLRFGLSQRHQAQSAKCACTNQACTSALWLYFDFTMAAAAGTRFRCQGPFTPYGIRDDCFRYLVRVAGNGCAYCGSASTGVGDSGARAAS